MPSSRGPLRPEVVNVTGWGSIQPPRVTPGISGWASVQFDKWAEDLQYRGDGSLSMNVLRRYDSSVHLSAIGQLHLALSFPNVAPVVTTFDTIGTHTYAIPYWCTKLDIVALGGGGGGQGGGALNSAGEGGNAAIWASVTKVRGTDIPSNAAQLSITVGKGGDHGVGPLKGVGTDGMPSSVQYATTLLLASAGGIAGSSGATGGDRTGHGPSPATLTFNGQTYAGGQYSPSSGQVGSTPGGGGSGGNGGLAGGSNGYDGGHGQVWIRAYQ